MTKTIKIIIGIIVAVIIIGGIWYGVIRKPGEKEVIKIGAIWHLTGPMSGIGEIFRNGALFAIDEINAKGGINGKKIILEIEDGQSDVKNSVSAFVKLVDVIGIKYIHSHGSAMSLALKPLVEEKKVLLFVKTTVANKNSLLRQSRLPLLSLSKLLHREKSSDSLLQFQCYGR